MLVLFPGGAKAKQPRGLDAGSHVRQLELDGLMLHDLFSKSLPLFGIIQRQLVCATGDAQRLGSNADTAPGQDFHGEFKAKAVFSDTVFPWHFYIGKQYAMGIAAPDA